ncbi:MAG: hypothetical protein KIS77_19395 [Saprospiraceae bacterium]|nr:hypothetical protein [Saprospiraceae bacterium]
MKLLHQTQRMFWRVALPVFVAAGVAIYIVLYRVILHETDEQLSDTRFALEEFARAHDTLPAFFQRIDARLVAVPMPPGATDFGEKLADTMLLNPLENELEPFRYLAFPMQIRGQWVQVSIFQSTLEQQELAMLVVAMLALAFGLLFGAILWVNRAVARNVWQPFYQTLDAMRDFRLTDQEPLRLPPAAAQEFRELNATLETLTDQVRKDFQTVKKFTENASHELQTPLAVIQNKVDLLLQDENLSEAQGRHLDLVGQSARRMARLNQALLLLSKIENNQFAEKQPVPLKPLVEKKLVWLEDFIAEKRLAVEADLTEKTLVINPFLAETLVANLLTNAVKHNLPDGWLRVVLDAQCLLVENAAAPPGAPVETLRERFARGNSPTDGLGLGLAMVGEICAQEGFGLELVFAEDIWATKIRFA